MLPSASNRVLPFSLSLLEMLCIFISMESKDACYLAGVSCAISHQLCLPCPSWIYAKLRRD